MLFIFKQGWGAGSGSGSGSWLFSKRLGHRLRLLFFFQAAPAPTPAPQPLMFIVSNMFFLFLNHWNYPFHKTNFSLIFFTVCCTQWDWPVDWVLVAGDPDPPHHPGGGGQGRQRPPLRLTPSLNHSQGIISELTKLFLYLKPILI